MYNIVAKLSVFWADNQRIKTFWELGAIAVFLHGVADPAITYFAVNVYEIGYEANPLLNGTFREGWIKIFWTHIPLYIISAAVFYGYTLLFQRAGPDEQQQLHRFSQFIWIVLIGWGLLLVLYNLSVLAAGI